MLISTIVSANEVAVVKVQYHKAEKLVPVVQNMLSAGGSVSVSQRVNSLIIVDNPEAIRRVHAYLEQFDKPVEQVRIHVRFNRTGKEIPYRQGSTFFRRHTPGGETLAWQTAESGFEVTPIVVGDNVHLKIVPCISYDDRKDTVIRFFEAQTELTALFGQWVEIGETTDQQNEIVGEILSQGTGGGNAVNNVSIMVERP